MDFSPVRHPRGVSGTGGVASDLAWQALGAAADPTRVGPQVDTGGSMGVSLDSFVALGLVR